MSAKRSFKEMTIRTLRTNISAGTAVVIVRFGRACLITTVLVQSAVGVDIATARRLRLVRQPEARQRNTGQAKTESLQRLPAGY
jgi:hypothetical protein